MGGNQCNCLRAAVRRLPWLACVVGLAAAPGAGCGPNPAAVDRLVAEGVDLAKAGETASALERFDRALRFDPEHPAALVNGGLAALLEGRPEEAKHRLERYLASDDRAVLPRVYLAHALAALGDHDGAIAALQAAVRHGFRDLEALSSEAFQPLRHDLRFVQLTSLVAQRNGRRAPVDDRGRPLFGGEALRTLSVPGVEAACADPLPPDRE